MTAVPSIVLVAMMAWMSMFAALILRKKWMRYVALGCAGLQVAMAIWLAAISRI